MWTWLAKWFAAAPTALPLVEGEVVVGIVRAQHGSATRVELPGERVGEIPFGEHVRSEDLAPGDEVHLVVLDVARDPVQLSRKSPQLVVGLFAREVPEIQQGVVAVEAVARDPGHRTKIAFSSADRDVDPIGACVGQEGRRVRRVVEALRGETIDLVPFEPDPARFVTFALAPAEIRKIVVYDEEHRMELVVPDDQLDRALGEDAVNLRLAAELTGWKLDLMAETKERERIDAARIDLATLEALRLEQVEQLLKAGFRALDEVAHADPDELAEILGIDPEAATALVTTAARPK
jgi:transcription termination/antitermination protein NusA